MNKVETQQVTVRLSNELVKRIDQERTKRLEKEGKIPSRTDIIRISLEKMFAEKS